MGFDGLFIHRIVQILNDDIKGSRVNRVGLISNNEFLFNLYNPRLKKDLLITVNQNFTHITLTNKHYSYSTEQVHFHGLLKKHLEGAYIEEVSQVNFDRIVKIRFRHIDEIGNESHKNLYLEIMGKYNNLILTKGDDTILDSLHRLPYIDDDKRVILPSIIYTAPKMNPKKDPFNLEDSFTSDNMTNDVYGVSRMLESILNDNKVNGIQYSETINKLMESITLYYNEKDFHLLPHSSFDKESNIYDGLNTFYDEKEEIDRAKRKSAEANRVVSSLITKIKNKLKKLEEELKTNENSDIYRKYGELLYSSYSPTYKKGDSFIEVEDYENETKIKIPLDSKKDIQENASTYFKKYKKTKASIEHINNQIEIAKEELSYLEDLELQLQTLDTEVIEQIILELKEQNYLKENVKKNNNKKNKIKFNILSITSSTGTKISIGRNNLQNEHLTFKIASINDIFLHVKDHRGAHVIIHDYKGDEETLREAANAAAVYSQAKYSSSVPVDYTPVKFVHKIPGGKPGKVLLKQYKTIYIDPEIK